MVESTCYDITFVGRGLSSTSIITNIILKLKENRIQKFNILLIEKENRGYGGFVYGEKSGYNSLIITPLNKFIFNNDYNMFNDWLESNKDKWVEKYRKVSFEGFKKWYGINEAHIKKNNFGEMMLPRFVYGDYLKDRFETVLSSDILDNVEFNLTYYHSEVIDIM